MKYFRPEKYFPLIEAEQNAFKNLSDQEQETLLRLTQKHISLLQKEVDQMVTNCSEQDRYDQK